MRWGNTLRADTTVVVFRIYDREPVFHLPRPGWEMHPAPSWPRSVTGGPALVSTETRCREPIDYRREASGLMLSRGARLPLGHAQKFGRPCRRCFPVLPAQLDL